MSSVITVIIMSILLMYSSASDVTIVESDQFKLSRNVIPHHYDLKLIPNMHKGTFEGSLKIEITILKASSEISVHCKNLKLVIDEKFEIRLQAQKSDRRNTESDKYGISGYNFTASDYSQSSNIIRIVFSFAFEPGQYILHFDKFQGSLENDNLEGFHFGEYENKDGDFDKFAVTQFGPSKARNAFPCFDEPFFRAEYKISITIPKYYNCISPYVTDSSSKPSRRDDKLVTVEFEYPVALPTYSVGFFISKLKLESISEFYISHVVADCQRLNLYKRFNYSIGVAEQIIIKTKKYLRVEFPLDVLYHIAIPDDWMFFESMGSWGFNTFREKELLYADKLLDKMLITISIAHKIAQQWFGNSISPDFWTWGWLTEGLATYVSYKIVDQINSDWLVTDLLMINTYHSMNIDFDCCIKSLSYEPKTPLEVSFKYGNTAAYKGAAMFRMIEEILPKKMFQQGLARFVQEKELSTVKSKDLYDRIEKFIKMRPNTVKIPMTLSEIMFNWEDNTGYPIIEVTRNQNEEEEITISQKSYCDKNSKSIWYIPINYSIKKPKTFNNVEPTDWLVNEKKQMTIKFLTRNSWIILNNKGFYYYRVKYDARNWNLIEQQLLEDHEEIHYLNRMQLISDSFSLADNGWIEYYVPLDLIKYIEHETRYAPLKALKDAADTLNKRLCGSYIKETFNDVITHALKIIIDNLQKQIFPEDLMVLDFVSFWLCELEPDQCYKHNKDRSGKFEKNAWCQYIQTDANENQWNELFKNYQNSSFDPDKFAALACAKNSRLLVRFLKHVMLHDKHRMVTAIKETIYSSNDDIGVNVALKFVLGYFEELLPILSEEELADIFASIGSRLTSAEGLFPLTKFARTHASYDYLTEPSIRKARENVKWRESNLKAVEKYFTDYKHSGSARTMSFNVVALFLNHMLLKNFI